MIYESSSQAAKTLSFKEGGWQQMSLI